MPFRCDFCIGDLYPCSDCWGCAICEYRVTVGPFGSYTALCRQCLERLEDEARWPL